MGYKNLRQCVNDLEKHKQLIRIDAEIDPYIEMGVIQRRVYENGGPALLFTNVKGCKFPMLGNLFGTMERTRFIFRDSLKTIEALVRAKLNPKDVIKDPSLMFKIPFGALRLMPKKVADGAVLECKANLSDLPQLVSWPMDGGAFITLPQVYTESSKTPGFRSSNLGMYRVQISGNDYIKDKEVGIHYQIHRGMGVHHQEAMDKGEPLKVNVFVGGAPSMTIAAVMPLPEGMPEISFAGVLGGHRISFVQPADGGLPIPAEADFCISGEIMMDETKPEGPFGDHIGYYSLAHDFPVMRVKNVYHRKDAIWAFTTVGRPPQEDTSFGEFIHELTGELIPSVLPGIHGVHAVDAAGVHPLLLAIGSERYTPYDRNTPPQEILTQANAVLGQGQLSLAKYLFISNYYDNPELDIHRADEFLIHMLERVDWRRDLHFQTSVTIDTLDYSGSGLNEGSKVVIAGAGEKIRDLPKEVISDLRLPEGFKNPRVAIPGVLVVEGEKSVAERGVEDEYMIKFAASFQSSDSINKFPLVVVVDDSEFTAKTLKNFLWVTFSRSNPSSDIYGIESSFVSKHFGCKGSLIIDARVKPHHAPPLLEVPEIEKRVDMLGAVGGALHGII